ncbi:MAG: helix-turn-helix domain-containing protein [Candidatus Lokiarchaeota archaeon]|nr:helix-turn-helix domain-containing protein [Candidatus Lokiarchaeota archaeon]MBD3202228.1 helix-turn-helix domain-containing protein [Candidatus Lokiarchaeota archaeon]
MEKLIAKINNLLKEKGFETFLFDFPQSSRSNYCYDLIVKKGKSVFIVKVFSNIDNINDEIIQGIKVLSTLFNSKPILIGIKNRYQNLEDNTIYIREELPFITIRTLKRILSKNLYPHVLARRGGGVVFLDGALMKSLREEKKISRKELSEELGVTKRTVCSYESENMRPSQEIAEKISEILENNYIFRNINVIDWKFDYDIEKDNNVQIKELNSFEEHIKNILIDMGIKSYWYKNGQFPFEFIISSHKTEFKSKKIYYPMFSDISEAKDKLKSINYDSLRKFTRLFHRYALFIINNNLKIPGFLQESQIPVIKLRNLEKMDDEQEFLKFIEDFMQF